MWAHHIIFFNRKECRTEMSQLQERNTKLKIQLEDTLNKVFIYILTLTSIYFRASDILLANLQRNKHTSVIYLTPLYYDSMNVTISHDYRKDATPRIQNYTRIWGNNTYVPTNVVYILNYKYLHAHPATMW